MRFRTTIAVRYGFAQRIIFGPEARSTGYLNIFPDFLKTTVSDGVVEFLFEPNMLQHSSLLGLFT